MKVSTIEDKGRYVCRLKNFQVEWSAAELCGNSMVEYGEKQYFMDEVRNYLAFLQKKMGREYGFLQIFYHISILMLTTVLVREFCRQRL